TVDGRPCRPLSLGARLPRVGADDNPHVRDPPPRGPVSGRLCLSTQQRRDAMENHEDSVAVGGSVAVVGSAGVAGSVAVSGSAGIVGSVLGLLSVVLVACVGCLGCVGC